MIGDRPSIARLDWPIIGLVLLLSIISVSNLYSTSMATGTNVYLVQMCWLGLGFVAMIVVALLDYRDLQRLTPAFYGVVVVLLALVLVFGKEVNGARRWLDLGFASFQPSEFAKIAVILALASWFQRSARPGGYAMRDLGPIALILGLPMFLILQEPDLGHTLMVLFIGLTMLSYERFERRTFLILLIIAVACAPLAWSFVLRDYQKERIMTLIDGKTDALGAGWHSRQARVAVGSGGLFGKGHAKGTQVAGGFLPENHTDFVFAHLAEEHGLVGAGLVLIIYLVLILMALASAARARDRFGGHAAVGIAGLLFWHVLMNVGMVLNLLPVTGVTLPLMSYGGTSVLTVMAAVGLLLNINLRRTMFGTTLD